MTVDASAVQCHCTQLLVDDRVASGVVLELTELDATSASWGSWNGILNLATGQALGLRGGIAESSLLWPCLGYWQLT